MLAELQQLQDLDVLLDHDEAILKTALGDADACIRNAEQRDPSALNIDDVLSAGTVVGEQLYNLVCEERGIEEAMLLLSRAVEKGRIDAGAFVRLTRGLARERFRSLALQKKAARGMGLTA